MGTKPDDINDHPASLTYETNIPVNTYAQQRDNADHTGKDRLCSRCSGTVQIPVHYVRRGAGHGDRLREHQLRRRWYLLPPAECRDVDLLAGRLRNQTER